MMNMFSGTIDFISRKSDSNLIIAVFALIYFISQMIIGSILHQIGTLNALALQTTLSSDVFKEIVTGWMASGEISIYYKHFYPDNFHPIWYSILLSLLAARAFKINHINPKFNFVILIPFVAGLCDIFENMMHLYFLSDLQRATPALVAVSGLATNAKWFLSLSVLGISCVLIVYWFVRTYLKKDGARDNERKE